MEAKRRWNFRVRLLDWIVPKRLNGSRWFWLLEWRLHSSATTLCYNLSGFSVPTKIRTFSPVILHDGTCSLHERCGQQDDRPSTPITTSVCSSWRSLAQNRMLLPGMLILSVMCCHHFSLVRIIDQLRFTNPTASHTTETWSATYSNNDDNNIIRRQIKFRQQTGTNGLVSMTCIYD